MKDTTAVPVPLPFPFEHAQRLTAPVLPPDGLEGRPRILVPQGWEAKEVPWDPSVPHRINQEVVLADHGSFCRYVTEFKGPSSRIFAMVSNDGGSFTAVLDYHGKQPAHCAHVVTFTPEKSENWKRWLAQNGKPMNQTEFAVFLENNTPDVVKPSGADLLQIVNEFEVDGGISFQRVQRLNSGAVKFSFQNQQNAKAGELSVPDLFVLRFPLFVGEPDATVEARFRYRLSAQGELKLWFELVNPHLAVRAGLDDLVRRIETGTGILPLMGHLS